VVTPTTFVIGADMAERLFAPKYYGDDERHMHVALDEIADSGCSFLVAVRIDAAGRVRALNDIPVPRRYADLFTKIPERLTSAIGGITAWESPWLPRLRCAGCD
jgi:hypothetical protein